MLTLEGPVEAVTIYRRAAVVTRRVTTALSPGEHDVELVGLPLSLVDASVRVQAEAEGAQISVAQVRIGVYVAPRADLPEPPSQTELREVTRRITLVLRRYSRLSDERDLLSTLTAPDRPDPEPGQAPGPSPLSARLALDGFVSEEASVRTDELLSLEAELAELERKRQDLEQKLQLASTAHHVQSSEVTKSAVCRLRVDEAAPQAQLTVRYQIPGVIWVPAYQVRVTDDQADIVMRAMVAQRSGEDWSAARLSVSTANPVSWTAIPKLTSLRIGREQDYDEPDAERPPPVGASALFVDYDADRRRIRAPSAAKFQRSPVAIAEPSDVDDLVVEGGGGAMVGGAAFGGVADGAVEEEIVRDVMSAPAMEVAMATPAAMMARLDDEMDAMEREEAVSPAAKKADLRRSRRKKEKPRGGPRIASVVQRPDLDAADIGRSALEAQILDELELKGPEGANRGALTRIERLDYLRRMVGRTGRPLGFSLAGLLRQAAERARSTGALSLPDNATPPDAASGFFDYTYDADAPVDIPSDGAFHSIPLSVRRGRCELTYVTVPRSDASVYRQARLENPEASPLLPGPAEIYVDGQYVLTAALPIVPGHGEFELGLGVEQAIRCARNVRFREARSSDKVVATNDLHHELRYALANDLDREVKCEVRERIPIPDEDAEVVVEERDIEPAWDSYDQRERSKRIKGGRRWKVTIPAGGETHLTATYVVRIYANHQIAGGNRRER